MDASELGDIYDRYATGLFRYAVSITANRDDAEDAVADVFAKLASLRKVPDGDKLGSYLYVSVRNACYSVIRKSRRETAGSEMLELVTDSGADQTNLEITEALMGLPPEQREVVVLECINGLTFEQIGKAMKVSTNTAASRYRYALGKLRKELSADADG